MHIRTIKKEVNGNEFYLDSIDDIDFQCTEISDGNYEFLCSISYGPDHEKNVNDFLKSYTPK